ELFENENIFVGNKTDINISFDLLKQLLLKEPEISSSPKSLAKLLLSSNKLLEIIEENEFIRLNIICRNFDMGVKNLNELFIEEKIDIEPKPTFKVRTSLLKSIIAKENNQELVRPNKILDELEQKINQSEIKAYTKSIILNQFVRSEQIR